MPTTLRALPEGIRRVFRLATRRPRIEAEVDEEIAFHLHMRQAELTERGWTVDAARDEASRRFGNVTHWSRAMRQIDQGRVRQERQSEWLADMLRDLRYTVRGLRRQPVFSIGVILTLALGIGANATMFGIVDRLLLRPPPHVVDAGSVHRLYVDARGEDGVRTTQRRFSYAAFANIRAESRSFRDVAVWGVSTSAMGRGTDARQISGAMASAGLFPLLGVRPHLGRFFAEEEDQPPRGARVAVIGYDLWRAEYGGDPAVLGRTIHLDGSDYQIIGVAPAGFSGPSLERVDAWMPVTAASPDRINHFIGDHSWWEVRGASWLSLVGRIAPGVSEEQAEAELALLYPRILMSGPDGRTAERVERQSPHVVLGGIQADRGPDRSPGARVATALLGVSALVLVIACANLGNLLLARAARRRREIAVRVALGVGRGRLIRQLLLESVLLALVGGVAALLVAHWGGNVVRTVLLPDVAWGETLADGRVMLFTMLAALVTGVLAGLVPALLATAPSLAGTLKSGSRDGGGRRARTRTILLVVQGALSVVLLVGAGLFVRSLINVGRVELGFEPERVQVVDADVFGAGYQPAQSAAIYDQLLTQVSSMPGVDAAAVVLTVPFRTVWDIDLRLPGRDSIPLMPGGAPLFNAVTPDYFRTVGTPFNQGRSFTAADRAGSEQVAIVSQSTARILWPAGDAIGQCIHTTDESDAPCTTVIGVVGDVQWNDLRGEPRHQIYVPLAQQVTGPPMRTLLVRPSGDPRSLDAALRQAVQEVAPNVAYTPVTPLLDGVEPQLRPWRMGATMFTAFGVLALIIAAVGLYSVLAYSVAQRAHELGVRVALGASTNDVLRLVVGSGLRVTAAGVVVGVVAALLLGGRIEPLLYDVGARDPVVIGSVAGILLLVAAVASLLPAIRAARVDPNRALRSD